MSTQAWGAAGREPTPSGLSCDLATTPTREVRRLVREALAGYGGIPVDDAILVTDELVSNAHRHGTAPRAFRLAVFDQRVRIEVDDASPALPRMRTPDRSGGRGLVLVDRLASSWGVQTHTDHKTVWAELALAHAGTSGHARHLAVAPNWQRQD